MTRLLHNSFDPYKAAEVAFLFLSAAGEGSAQISKFRLMKCMYLAERKSYERYAEPMIGDMPCSMQHGPALVSILEFLRSPDGTTPGHQTWNSVVAVGKVGSQKYLSLNNDCPFKTVNDLRKMSDSEINLVLEIDEEFRHMSAVKMGQSIRRHLMCSEWKWNQGDTITPIDFKEFLSAVGYGGPQVEAIINKMKEQEAIEALFRS